MILSSKGEEEESEGLALLIPDIQETARIVSLATQRLKEAGGTLSVFHFEWRQFWGGVRPWKTKLFRIIIRSEQPHVRTGS